MFVEALLTCSVLFAGTGQQTPGQILETAQTFERRQDYPQAIVAYREYLRLRPENDEVRGTLAKLLSWQGEHDEAISLYRDILTRHPSDLEIRTALARVLSWQKQFDEARQLYQAVLREDANQLDAGRGLADVLFWSGHGSEALPYYEQVFAATHDPDVAKRMEAIKAAPSAPTLSSVIEAKENQLPAPTAEILVQARRFEAAQRYPEAIAAYRDYLALRPDDDEVRTTLAKLLSWQGHHADAEALYRDVLTRHPADRETRIALARVLSWQKQFDEAQAIYDEVLREDPKNVDARKGRADVAFWRGDRTEALKLYESIFAETKDKEVQRQIQSVKAELVASLRAPIGQGLTGLRLPYRDYAKVGYGHYSYTRNIPDERDLLFEVAKPIGDQTLVVRVEPINRFGFHDTPVSAEYYSPLWQRAWGYVAAQGTMNPNFAPNYSFVGEVSQGLGGVHSSLAPVEVSFGYRRLNYKKDDIDLLLPGLTLYLPFNLWITERVYIIPSTGASTLSSQLTWRPTDRLQFFASGSFGTSSERIVAAQDFTRVGGHTIGGGVMFPVTERFSVEAAGYYEDRGFLYVRRGGNLSLIYHW
jgi:YaiO family outer membrane protein